MTGAKNATGKQQLGERLRERREQLGLSQARVAAELGCSRGTVILWETGRHEPETYAEALAALYGWTVDQVRVPAVPGQPTRLELLERQLLDMAERVRQLEAEVAAVRPPSRKRRRSDEG